MGDLQANEDTAGAAEDWLRGIERLGAAETPEQAAEAIVQTMQSCYVGVRATVVWAMHSRQGYRCVPVRALEAQELEAALAASRGQPVLDAGDQAWCLFSADRNLPDSAVLLLRGIALPRPEAQLQRELRVLGRLLRRVLELGALRQSHRQLERSEVLQRALFAISDLAGAELDMHDMLRRIHTIVSTLMYAENFFIVRYDAAGESLRFLHYADIQDPRGPQIDQDIPLKRFERTTTWYVLTGGKALMGSSEQLRQQVDGPVVIWGPDSVDWLGVPMVVDGLVAGAIVVQSYRSGVGYSGDDRTLLEFVGSHILTALQRKQGKDELEQRVQLRTQELAQAIQGLQLQVEERLRAEHLQAALFQIAQLATADIDEGEFYRRVHTVVGELLNAENFFIGLLSPDRQQLQFPYYVDSGQSRSWGRPLGRGLSEYVLRSGAPLMGLHRDLRYLVALGEVDPSITGRPSHCWLGVPLRVADEVIGLIVVQSYTESVEYRQADRELLSFVASQIANTIFRRRSTASLHQAYAELEQRVEERTHELRAQILQRELVQQQLKHQIMHDPLTGLPNRGYLRERIEQVLARQHKQAQLRCALLYLDLDRFKVINDSLGHLAGDTVLKEVATRLLSCVRTPAVVARLSGDEFAILLEDVVDSEVAQNVARRIFDALSVPLPIAGKELQPSTSIGIALGDAGYRNADDLLRDADIALYHAKQSGRKRFELFDETLAKHAIDELTMEAELHQALLRDEFEPYFQPIFRLEDGLVVGYEALLRWNHPQRGVLGPNSLLKVAQESGRIETIDWKLFELACTQFARHAPADTFLTINVSALHLRHADFDLQLVQLLKRTGMPTARLITEVTEGSLLDDPDMVRATLERLRAIGVGAALDDFGTGYSSLSYLHSLPLRMLKIDRAFVHALDDVAYNNSTTVVTAILALARALNIEVIAEGIETSAQRQLLQSMGCVLGQGFLLGSPAPGGQWFTHDQLRAG
jgi:diguanylate cyclase (GGDEF)-like protein